MEQTGRGDSMTGFNLQRLGMIIEVVPVVRTVFIFS
jgi:hypothetical protein